LFDGSSQFVIENEWFNDHRFPNKLPNFLKSTKTEFGLTINAPRILYFDNLKKKFTHYYTIGAMQTSSPEDLVECYIRKPFGEDLSAKSYHKLFVSFKDNPAITKLAHFEFQLTTGIQIYAIAKCFDIDLSQLTDDNIDSIVYILDEVSSKAKVIDKDMLSPIYTDFIDVSFREFKWNGNCISFAKLDRSYKIVSSDFNETEFGTTEPNNTYYMIGRLVQLALVRYSKKEISHPLKQMFAENKMATPSVFYSSYNANGEIRTSLKGLIDVVFSDNSATTLVAIKDGKRLSEDENPKLTLELGESCLWKDPSVCRKALFVITPSFNLAFYSNGNPYVKSRAIKIVTCISTPVKRYTDTSELERNLLSSNSDSVEE
jgi:hypothetical protein